MTQGTHTVRSYDEELRRLENLIAEMGGLAEVQLAAAMQALIRRDSQKAFEIAANDERIDLLETRIDHQAVSLLALRQPMAQDLREIIGALKASNMLERIGDYAKNVAKRTAAIIEYPPVPPAQSIARIGQLAQEMIKDVLDAYLARDLEKAERVRERDRELDALYTSVFRELLTYMMEDPRNITPATHILFIAKNLERVGDHATNLAELVYFIVRGRMPPDDRMKNDTSSYAVTEHPLQSIGKEEEDRS
jgi:phosphate transport system protein